MHFALPAILFQDLNVLNRGAHIHACGVGIIFFQAPLFTSVFSRLTAYTNVMQQVGTAVDVLLEKTHQSSFL